MKQYSNGRVIETIGDGPLEKEERLVLPEGKYRLAFACPYYGTTQPTVSGMQRANVMNVAADGHTWVEDYSTVGMQHRGACEHMSLAAAKDDRIDMVFWTEHDVVLPPDAVQKLIKAMDKVPDADIMTGIVFRRCEPYTPMVSFINDKLTMEEYEEYRKSPLENLRRVANTLNYEEMKSKSLVHLDHIDTEAEPFLCGTASMGCLLFRRRAFQAVVDMPDLFAVDPYGFFSIDNCFFFKCKDKGLKLYCDPSILCGHMGDPEIVGWQQWRGYVNKLMDKAEEQKQERLRKENKEVRIYGELTRLANKHRTDKGTHDHNMASGWSGWVHNYCDFYESVLASTRIPTKKVLEIGIFQGSSLKMWKDYFPNAEIFGIDISLDQLKFDPVGEGIVVGVGDQSKREDLDAFVATQGSEFDLIVDDGGHMMDQQQISLGHLFPHVKPGGCYIVEDLFTSFLGPAFGVEPDGKNATVLLIEALAEGRQPESKYLTPEELQYLKENVESVLIYGKKSLTCILKKKGE